MTQIKVNTSGISGLERKMGDVVRQCSDCESVVSRVRLGLDWDIKVKDNIGNRLSSLERQLQNQEEKARELKNSLGDVSEQFTRKDRQLEREMKALLLDLGINGNISDGSAHTGNNHNEKNSWLKKLLEFLESLYTGNLDVLAAFENLDGEVFGAMGFAGSFLGGLFGMAKGTFSFLKGRYGDGVKYVANGAKNLWDSGKGLFKLINGTVAETGAKVASAGARAAKSVKSAGTIITVVANAADNVQEAMDGKISGGRAVAETISESAIDIALMAGAMAATAVCPAAPLIYIAIKTVVDIGFEVATGDNSTEALSDWLWNAVGLK